MPWCPTCDRFLSPSTVKTDGACPTCGRTVDPGRARPPGTEQEHSRGEPGDDDSLPPVPWHLKLLLAALAVYLGFRAWQGIEWLLGKF